MKKTLVMLLAPFKYSPDGIKVIDIEPGEHELNERQLQIAQELGIVDDAEARRQAEEEAAAAVAAEQKRQAEEEAANAELANKATQPPIQPSKAPAKNKATAKANAGAK